ncbi:MAG: TlpA disulfide reductase family protein [Knoellia sp.]
MSSRTTRYAVSRAAIALTSVFALVALGACSSDPNSIAEQAKKGDQKGYIAGNGAIEQIPVDKRLTPVTLEGATLDGRQWSSTSERGKNIVVVNLWGSWCPPCIVEIPDIEKVWTDVQAAKKPVQFMGIDFREDTQRGAAFVRTQKMTYPSLTDESGVLILAFGRQAPTSPPSTLILDREGRVAARANGAVTAATLQGLIDDVLASGPAS